MPNTVQLTQNGQPVFPVTDESLVMGLNSRPYNSSNPDGMGYLVLKKNKTFAEQVTEENTIYEIRYDFDLGGASVSIPEGCVLSFNGGILSNGSLVGDSKSRIISNAKCLDSVTLHGFDGVFYARWFGDDLTKVFPFVHNCELHLDGITYQVTQDILVEIGTRIIGHNTTIQSTAHFYCGWRTKIDGIHFISTNSSVECITILGSKVYESRQHFTDYEDDNFLIIGIEIKNCIFNSAYRGIVLQSSVVSNSVDPHGFDGSGFSFHIHNNQFNRMGDDNIVAIKTEGWYTAFEIVENVCNSGKIFFHAISDHDSIKGINIVRNDVQLTNANKCAVKLEAASVVNISNNRFWDFYDGAVVVTKNNCEAVFVEIPSKGESTPDYIKFIDKTYTEQTKLSSVNTTSILGTDFVGYLQDPTHVDENNNPYYLLVDFFYMPLGNYKVKNNLVQYLIGNYSGINTRSIGWVLNISRPVYRQIILTLYPSTQVMGYGDVTPFAAIKFETNINTDSNDYISYTMKASPRVWKIYQPTFAGATPALAVPGIVYFDTTQGELAYSDNNNVLKSYDGSTLGVKKNGITANRPSAGIYVGFTYFDTDLGKMIVWNGSAWVNMDGSAL